VRARSRRAAAAGALAQSVATACSIIALAIVFLATQLSEGANIELPLGDPAAPISIAAEHSASWRQGEYTVWHLQGNCRVRQDATLAQSREAVIWVERGSGASGELRKAIVYLEGDVLIEQRRGGPPHAATGHEAQAYRGETWLGRFHTLAAIEVHASVPAGEPAEKPPALYRGLRARELELDRSTVRADFAALQREAPAAQLAQIPAPIIQSPAQPAVVIPPKRILVRPRGPAGIPLQWFPSPSGTEQIGVISAGVQIVIEGLMIENVPQLGAFDPGAVTILTDRTVIWTNSAGADLAEGAAAAGDAMWEFYLEGNIVFRQGDRVIYADRMYYNATQEYGVVLSAEILTPAPGYEGLVRLKANVLQQLNRQTFVAQGAAITSSRLGVPRYWLQSETITLEDNPIPRIDPLTGQPAIDPLTGAPIMDHQMLAESRNNWVFVGGAPVFYWPTIATRLEEPTFYIESVRVGNDRIFGFQLGADVDAYQLFGVTERPAGTDWTIGADYFSKRGPGFNTHYEYARQGAVIPGPYFGFLDAWFIHDTGFDNLGLDRRMLVPEEELRGRALFNHRHRMPQGYQLTAEAAWISDRNFLEQYFEQEWDEHKDEVTALELKRNIDNASWSVLGQVRVNDFFTQTNWLPRLDHYLLGQNVLGVATWHAHSHVGYGKLEPAAPPEDPQELPIAQLPWEAEAEGIRAATRQEIDVPLLLGPVKAVPYALGEIAHWEEDLAQDEVTRLYGQAGVRTSMTMWNVDPLVENRLFNLSGLSHKVTFEGDFFWAEADQDLSRFPLYDPLQDDAQERFQQRFIPRTFGGVLPPEFDERFYALRNGMQGWVAAASTEIADDLTAARLGISQRWQTKRGLPGQQRIVDWISLDVEGVVFPDAPRDNFGEELGLLNYDFRWHVGDRVTLLSDGFYDFFNDGLRTISLGTLLSRPGRTEFYLGLRSIEGPISSNIVTTSTKYRMSEKWIAHSSLSYDFGETGSIGQSLGLTRIGESALFHLALNVDHGRDNVGLVLAIEPRFLPSSRSTIAGAPLPPVGALGLE
jgi:hypothetical protein